MVITAESIFVHDRVGDSSMSGMLLNKLKVCVVQAFAEVSWHSYQC
jgi:hypothetical protein